MARIFPLSPVLLALTLLPPTVLARSTASNPSIRPLSWTSPIFDDEGEVEGVKVRNHCTTWAYRAPDAPQVVHWITAAHCVLDEDTNELEEHDYQIDKVLVNVEAYSVSADLASLEHGPDAPGLSIASKSADVLDPVIIQGFPFGWSFMVSTKGYLAVHGVTLGDFPDQVYDLYNVSAGPGNSGSPVFNDKMRVIGVLQIGFGRGMSILSGGTPTEVLHRFLDILAVKDHA